MPFYSDLLGLVLSIAVIAAIIYWVAARGWQLRNSVPDWSRVREINLSQLGLGGALETRFLRGIGAVFLLALAVRFFLGRYSMLLDEHGSFMVGIDYVDQNIALPLQWVLIASCVLSAVASSGRKMAARSHGRRGVYHPQRCSVHRERDLRQAQRDLHRAPFYRQAYCRYAFRVRNRSTHQRDRLPGQTRGTDRSCQTQTAARQRTALGLACFSRHPAPTAALPPYTYSDTDVDRYTFQGEMRQVLISPRELDLTQLGDRWINTHFIYTHGYGVVMAEANQVSSNGLPELIIKDTPPEITVPGLKLNRPELYYGENVHDPVFVRTAQPEFDYPAGDRNVETRYEGKGGFPISSFLMRTAAAVSRGDWNILLTGYLTPESRMMIHRNVTERLSTLANFLAWDTDPYLVLTDDGRPVWIVDGYMTSNVHPYSRSVALEGIGAFNYIRNSVKATIDAYDGTVHLYVFDTTDPLLQAYRNLFPDLFEPDSGMPADLRRHVRYPEMIFAAQSDIYRLFHMRDADTFYNRSDAWDVAKFTNEQGAMPGPVAPSYVVATLPGETQPEFLLMIPFTPRSRDNLIGLMMARCDGPHLGEKIVLLLSKQEIIYGPMQVEARINQDQNISKDLTLWNQQGSQVLRGQMLVLPIEHTFLYVEPIYIQASQAKMPQLKKVALAMGNNLVYADTYQEALAQLAGENLPAPEAAANPRPTTSSPPAATQGQAAPPPDARISEVRRHLQRYRDLVSQGKLSEAGKELEAIQSLVER